MRFYPVIEDHGVKAHSLISLILIKLDKRGLFRTPRVSKKHGVTNVLIFYPF